LWFQKLGDLLLVFSNFPEFTLEKSQIFLFFPKNLSPQCEDSPQKTKEKTNNFVYAPPNNLHLFTKFQQSIGVI
jgi:hypothetical protein